MFWNKDPNKVIYLIDDEKDVLSVYAEILEDGLQGYSVKKFTSLFKALESLEKEKLPPRLIICDIRLKDENGLRIKQLLAGNLARIPVIHLTGLGGEDIKDENYHILSKPIPSDDLLVAVRRYL
ncbi:MAG: response regulator [Halobacteriovoraceae bacterium]|nr:response regulator [Halobacteriovoraceae bacterium]